MTTVFLSGSRKISRLNGMIRERLQRMIDQRFGVVVGDANGADKALQTFLADQRYDKIEVFCTNGDCRNNVGNWPVRSIHADRKLKGRAFYTVKDRQMADEADYGLVLWDGKRAGAANNIRQLGKGGRKAVVYYAPEKRFANVATMTDVDGLLEKCDPQDFQAIKASMTDARPREEHAPLQGTLNL